MSTVATETVIMPMAVIYLRVSTKEQAGRGGEVEGFSIPAQREACQRKAEALGVQVVAQFVDAGESARSANSSQLKAMLDFVTEHRVKYVIVHKVDHLARNRVDDVEINLQITTAGAQLVSCSENIDETPSGMLLHGIMSSIAEFYSQKLATESKKGMLQKAKGGGTPGKAPFGYLNTRVRTDEGHEMRTVVIDPQRAEWVKWVFTKYATGDWPAAAIRNELNRHNVTTLPTPSKHAGEIAVSHVHNILRNRYYVGVVTYDGVEYQGKHPTLVSEDLFATVQRVRAERYQSKDKPRVHANYLKGWVYCGQCGEALSFEKTRNARGNLYEYFYCLGRQAYKNGCTFRATQVHMVEQLVEDHWQTVTLTASTVGEIRRLTFEHIELVLPRMDADRQAAQTELASLESQSQKLMAAHYADAVSLQDLKREQATIALRRANAKERISKAETNADLVRTKLATVCDLLSRAHEHYVSAPKNLRRTLNRAIFEHIYIDDDEVVGSDLTSPFQRLMSDSLADDLQVERRKGQTSRARTSDLRLVPEVTENATRDDDCPIADLLRRSARTSPEDRTGAFLRPERPRGALPWETKNPGPIKDRGSTELLLVAGAGFEPATSGL